ncbi:glycosyltransferase [Hymenobacter sp. GOD-10R]|uniref:glycosyltransferase n=1 Tax=Hymenobacter sp. GOD-10R TaxID=3093922 RepID=UPI002D79F576|nr:glycosyltransferase [Hymenobacter sp. GOD-10R]WRQ26349.1 glycosyltransferase [Hymenobacter sp. GOD-10R]
MALSPLLLASVLKPLDDTRMYGKFGRTLASRPDLDVHVAGRRAPRPENAPPNLHTHELLAGSRLSLGRLVAQWRYWQLLKQVKPRLVIVHAPELLPLTLLWRSLGGERHFVYDVRENYALNILTQQVYPSWLRRILASLVRRAEKAAARRAAKIILAERSYADELPFATAERTVILENKYQPQPGEAVPTQARPIPEPDAPLQLLYSGTISKLNGVFEAIGFAQKLREQWPAAHLTIIGFCQQPEVLAQLQAIVAADPGITLIGGGELIPHARIVAEIQRSHLGLLPYQHHPSSARCMPTKLFEYLANGLPILTPPAALWTDVVNELQAGMNVTFRPPFETPNFAERLRAHHFYPRGIPPEAFWASEAPKLWQIVDSLS